VNWFVRCRSACDGRQRRSIDWPISGCGDRGLVGFNVPMNALIAEVGARRSGDLTAEDTKNAAG